MTLQNDWLKYLKNSELYTYDHFAPLITDTENPVNLEIAFGTLPNGPELIRRINCVRNETNFTGLYHIPKENEYLPKHMLRPLAEEFADSVAELMKGIGENDLARQVEFNQLEYITKSSWKRNDPENKLRLNDAFDYIGDEFIEVTSNMPHFFAGLEEAVLFMTKIPEVTRYILGAMVNFPVNDKAAYELWKGGARVDFGEEKTYIILADDYEEPKVA